jgi:histidyl-tRNA synthetase
VVSVRLSSHYVLIAINGLELTIRKDYYTGVIYEVVTEGSAPPSVTETDGQKTASKRKKSTVNGADEDRSNDPTVGVGSVAAGGRYDE